MKRLLYRILTVAGAIALGLALLFWILVGGVRYLVVGGDFESFVFDRPSLEFLSDVLDGLKGRARA